MDSPIENATAYSISKELLKGAQSMRVFVTGATGFIGSAIVRKLIGAEHQVLGLARSDAAAKALAAAGAQVHRGALEDLDSVKRGAAASDGVIHAAFNNIGPGTDIVAASRIERSALEAIGEEALAGSDKPLVMVSGTAFLAPGRLATEEDTHDPNFQWPSARVPKRLCFRWQAAASAPFQCASRSPSMATATTASFLLSSPWRVKRALRRMWATAATAGPRCTGWDAARLFRLALEEGPAGSRFHGVGDEGVPFREIAAVIGRRLNLPVVSKTPEEAVDHFAWMALFTGVDAPTSSAKTRERLGWRPTQPGIISDLERSTRYFSA